MRYRRVGNSGLVVSEVGLGGNNFGRRLDLKETRAVVHTALEHGVTFIDTAESYGAIPGASEELLGEVLESKRDQVIIGTKFGHHKLRANAGPQSGSRGGRSAIRIALEGSLRRLKTDYIDLYQYHRFDPGTPLEETVSTLADLVREGKIRYFGHTAFRGWQIAESQHLARLQGGNGFVSGSYLWNMIERWAETDTVPTAVHYGLGIFPYFPLAQGLLTGKISRKEIPLGARLSTTPELATNEALDVVEKFSAWARPRDLSVLNVAFGGLTHNPAVASVIAGASNPQQVIANIEAAEWHPSEAEYAEIDALNPSTPWTE
ncbi:MULTISPECIES: aldo/keto reductase [unclassified Arthrobacter]|uniref:aldo/keto reductase n=1 Tax=unclassified Arthrobacter TaxID=235627 RepID=UPI001C851861|nr:aldo/keto reductase [Arthrobacter sp. MAHUQ-56]MBX7444608.1 aldo/keto reductase [Arthrobacter sp. MAHUQ-56]